MERKANLATITPATPVTNPSPITASKVVGVADLPPNLSKPKLSQRITDAISNCVKEIKENRKVSFSEKDILIDEVAFELYTQQLKILIKDRIGHLTLEELRELMDARGSSK